MGHLLKMYPRDPRLAVSTASSLHPGLGFAVWSVKEYGRVRSTRQKKDADC